MAEQFRPDDPEIQKNPYPYYPVLTRAEAGAQDQPRRPALLHGQPSRRRHQGPDGPFHLFKLCHPDAQYALRRPSGARASARDGRGHVHPRRNPAHGRAPGGGSRSAAQVLRWLLVSCDIVKRLRRAAYHRHDRSDARHPWLRSGAPRTNSLNSSPSTRSIGSSAVRPRTRFISPMRNGPGWS